MQDLRDWTEQGQGMGQGRGETIFALASGTGSAGVGVIRISGPEADGALAVMTDKPLPEARRAVLRRLHDGHGAVLDQALVLRFGPRASYTGECVVELHCHGGTAVVSRILRHLSSIEGCRLAEPGEFTRRAFEAGRMDLAEVEALGDLIAAETDAQHRQAIRNLEGALHRAAEEWRLQLVAALALVEVTIDWADEEVPEDVGPEVAETIEMVEHSIRREMAGFSAAEGLRSGFEVAFVGAPNAGKSSLLNYLARREAAITSAQPGTTRDIIELRYDLGGLPVIFLDMAGLRDAEGVEGIGVAKACARARSAAMRIFLDAPDAPVGELVRDLWQDGDVLVRSKADLCDGSGGVSTVSGEGMSELLGAVAGNLSTRSEEAGVVTNLRQHAALSSAAGHLSAGRCAGANELMAEEIRAALSRLERLIGGVGVEDVLDEVFSRFCLGK